MKIITYSYHDQIRLGVLLEREAGSTWVVDLNRADPRLPADMITFLEQGDSALELARAAANTPSPASFLALSEVTLLAPIPRPRKIICIGHNYQGHSGATPPAYPDVFAKFANVVIASGQNIIVPKAVSQVDYEGELAVVIGKRARYVPQDRALEAIAGYTIFNDVSARDYQKRQSQWTIGKSFDTFGPLGPALVTRDEVGDAADLDLTLWVNGEERQRANTRDLIFPVPFLVSYLSQVITLEPGDVIATGTPSGTGASRTPPVFLKAGDVVRIAISKIGMLENTLALEDLS